jgi:hypothetical protein
MERKGVEAVADGEVDTGGWRVVYAGIFGGEVAFFGGEGEGGGGVLG